MGVGELDEQPVAADEPESADRDDGEGPGDHGQFCRWAEAGGGDHDPDGVPACLDKQPGVAGAGNRLRQRQRVQRVGEPEPGGMEEGRRDDGLGGDDAAGGWVE